MSYTHINKRGKKYYLNKVGNKLWLSLKKTTSTIDYLPDGYKIMELPNGMPYVKKL